MLRKSVCYFVSAARHGSMRRASEEHHVAQSAVSRRIQALEKEIGTPLLVRGLRGVTLTEAGARLMASVDAVDHETSKLLSEIDELRQLSRGMSVSPPSSRCCPTCCRACSKVTSRLTQI